MKNFFLCSLIFALSGTAYLHSQNVGIGTVTPQAKVHVVPDNAAGILLSAYGVNPGQTGELRFSGVTGSGYIALKAPDNTPAPVILSLPSGDGSSGQVLSTNGSGRLQWANANSPVSGGGCCAPPNVSLESPGNLNLGQMMVYCDSLTEGGYTDWHLPTMEELFHATSGTATVPGTRSMNFLRTLSHPGGLTNYMYLMRLSDGEISWTSPSNTAGSYVCRCIR